MTLMLHLETRLIPTLAIIVLTKLATQWKTSNLIWSFKEISPEWEITEIVQGFS